MRYFSAAKPLQIRSTRDRPYLEAAPSIKVIALAQNSLRLPSTPYMDVMVSNKLLRTKFDILKCRVSTHSSARIRNTPEVH